MVRCDDVVPFLPKPGSPAGSYEATGHVFLLLKPPAFDYSRNVEIERDFVYQLRLDLDNGLRGKLAPGHRMATYLKALGEYPTAGRSDDDPNWFPVFYSTERQAMLCPSRGS